MKRIVLYFSNYFKENKRLIYCLGLCCIFIFGIYIVNGRLFLFNADQQLQYHYFYEEWLSMIDQLFKTHQFPFYSWNTFLGNNFYAAKAYYVTGDIFLPILYLFRNHLEATLKMISIFLVFVSGLTFSSFLKEYGIKKRFTIDCISLMYALGGTATIFVGQYMFQRFYAFFPLLLWGVERYLNRRRFTGFSIAMAILFLSSYYLMFPASWFLVLYFLFSCYRRERKMRIIYFLKKAMPLIGAYMLGLMISGIITIPAVIYTLGNSRLGEYNTWGNFWELKVLIGFIFSYVTPPFNLYTTIPYLFISGFNGHDYWYSIYSSVLGCLLLFSFLFQSNKRDKLTYSIPYFILLIFTFIKPLNSIIHGFSQPSFRWMYLVITFGLIIAAHFLDTYEYEQIKMKHGFIAFLILYTGFFIAGILTQIIDFRQFKIHILVSLLFLSTGLLYCWLWKKQNKNLILILLCCELSVGMGMTLWNLSKDYQEYRPSLEKNLVQYEIDMDEDQLFRIYIDSSQMMPISTMNKNQSLPLGYMSVSTYDSTYEPSLTPFLRNNHFNWHNIQLTDPDLMKLLGVKYYYVKEESELPAEIEFEYIKDINEYHIYKLKDYNHLGFTFSQFVPESEVNPQTLYDWEWDEALAAKLDQWDWSETLIVPDDLYERVKDLQLMERRQLIIDEHYANSFIGTLDTDQQTVLFISIPYSKGWRAFDNDSEIPVFKVNESFVGLFLEPGTHRIQLSFTPPGFKAGVIASALGGVGWLCLFIWERKKRHEKN